MLNIKQQKIFITGTAGFIGYHLAQRLLDLGHFVVGYDGMTDYYDVNLKMKRKSMLERSNGYKHVEAMLEDDNALNYAVTSFLPDIVVHLAGQAGVRYSLEHPKSYIQSNILGTFNMMEAVRNVNPKHFLIASSSSVYGANTITPFREEHKADWPITIYAATKKAVEEMSHSYSHLWKIPTTCFRFFTVYGPWGRPDMALFKFVSAIENSQPIEVYGNGDMARDFTYIDDLIEAVLRLIDVPPSESNRVRDENISDSLSPVAPWRVVNIGGGKTVSLMSFISEIERATGKVSKKIMLPEQKGELKSTFASPDLLSALIGFVPETSIADGIDRFVAWHRGEMRGESKTF